MLPILTPADFVGPYKISNNQFTEDILEQYITDYEQYYIKKLFSDQAYIDISTQDPLQQKYLDLINGVTWFDSTADENKVLQGFKKMLVRLVFYHWKADNFQESPVGSTQNLNENSTRVSDGANRANINRIYNQAIEIYCNELIQFIIEYDSIQEPILSFVDEGAGLYTINVSETTYLADGNIVSIGGVEYTVSNVTADTSFQINTGTPGESFTGNVYYEPFKDFNLPKLSTAWL